MHTVDCSISTALREKETVPCIIGKKVHWFWYSISRIEYHPLNLIIFGREPSPWTTSVFNMLEYSIRGVFNKWGNTVYRYKFLKVNRHALFLASCFNLQFLFCGHIWYKWGSIKSDVVLCIFHDILASSRCFTVFPHLFEYPPYWIFQHIEYGSRPRAWFPAKNNQI